MDLDYLIDQRPVLAICYGAQMIANHFGGEVQRSKKREYGKASLSEVVASDPLFHEIPTDSQVWMSHGDSIMAVPEKFEITAATESIPVAAF